MNTLSEREIQRHLVSDLRKLGHTVCVTSNGRKTANTRGTPDVFVHVHDGFWLGLEIKRDKGELTEEQSVLEKVGAVQVIRSVEDGIKLVLDRIKWRLLKVRGTIN